MSHKSKEHNYPIYLVMLIPFLYGLSMLIKESIGRTATTYSAPCS